MNSFSLKFSLIFFFSLMLSACGSDVGSGEVGEQKDAAPLAKVEVLGISADLSQPTTRSGTDVILSAQNSVGIDDPLMRYEWKQTDNSGYAVRLFERTNNTVAFTTPDLPADLKAGVTLTFELTVTDADGVSAKSNASVKVIPVGDPNRYLVNPNVSESIQVYLAATPGTNLAANVPASIRVTPIFRWQDRLGNSQELIGEEKIYTSQLTAGRAGEIVSESSAFVRIPMPDLDLDYINQYFQKDRRSGRLEIEKLDTVSIDWQISLEATSGQTISAFLVNPSNKQLINPVPVLLSGRAIGNAFLSNSGAGSAILDVEKLRQALGLESKLSALNYHRCIDPLNQATTFDAWLNQSGYKSANANDIHTKYINNYDLGFGRDMHIRTDENGNVFSYVSNYNNLENTISNRNAFAIVVMEYSPAPTGNCGDGTFTDIKTGKKIVKFYTYVPDEVNGGFKRALSMNFDGRGEKYMPGSCTACHAGKTNAEFFNSTSAIAATAADLDSSFMPWDLDAFLYTHASSTKLVDPAYASFATTNKISSEKLGTFSRETQEAKFKQQNQATLHTYTQDLQKLKRYETAIKLIRGWYSNDSEIAAMEALNFGSVDAPLTENELLQLQSQVKTLPAGNYNGNFVLKNWRINDDVEMVYEKVFDRHCRLCHVQMSKPQIDFDSYDEFINHPQLVDFVYNQGSMPMSRLTMDRFWTHFNNEKSAATILREHLNSAKQMNLAADITPGFPIARIAEEALPEQDADLILDFDQQLILDGSGSFFSDTYQWRVNSNIVSQTPLLSMNSGTPGIQYSATLVTQGNGFTSNPVSRRIKVNNYTPEFNGAITANVSEGGSVQLNLLNAICTDAADSRNCRQYFGDIRAGEKPQLVLEQNITNGQATWINQTNGIISFQSTNSAASGNGQFAFRLIDSFGEMSGVITVNITVAGLAAPQIGTNDTCQTTAITSANSNSFPINFNTLSCPNPMLNDTAAPGLTLSLIGVSAGSQQGGSVSLSNGIIRYTPPKFFVGTDSFTYTVRDNSLSQRTATGTVTVTVTASMTYTSLKTHFATNCAIAGCHQPARFGAGPNWSTFSTLIPRLDDSIGTTGGNLNLTVNTSLLQILNTRLFIYACSEDSHFGGNQLCNSDLHEVAPTNGSQLNTMGQNILQWIEEGARNN